MFTREERNVNELEVYLHSVSREGPRSEKIPIRIRTHKTGRFWSIS